MRVKSSERKANPNQRPWSGCPLDSSKNKRIEDPDPSSSVDLLYPFHFCMKVHPQQERRLSNTNSTATVGVPTFLKQGLSKIFGQSAVYTVALLVKASCETSAQSGTKYLFVLYFCYFCFLSTCTTQHRIKSCKRKHININEHPLYGNTSISLYS